MFLLAWKNLWQERGRFFIAIGSISVVVFLVLVLNGILNGATLGATSYIDNLKSEIVVMQDGVANMHMASSLIPSSMVSQIRSMKGVKKAEGILYLPGFARVANGKKIFGYFSGIEANDIDVGPWDIVAGRNVVRGKEVVVDKNILKFYGLGLGDKITLLDKKLTIVGASKDTGPLLNPVIFIPKDKLATMTKTQGRVSYIFVWPDAEVDSTALMARISDRFKGDVNVMTVKSLSNSDRVMIGKMSSDLVQIIVYVTLLVGLMVVVLMLYTLTMGKIRDYGIIKAVGGSPNLLMLTALWQGLLLSVIGIGVGILLALVAFPAIEYLSPGIGAFMTIGNVITVLVQFIIVGTIASILPIIQIRKIDPMLVFKI